MKESAIPAKRQETALATRDEDRTMTPAVDIFEVENGLGIVADMPGVDKEGVHVAVNDNVLTIKGTITPPADADVVYREFELHNYFREFQLSDAVDRDNIKAELKGGVLSLTLPRVPAQQPKKIEVKVS